MICPNCNTECPKNSEFCLKCGAKFTPVEPEMVEPIADEEIPQAPVVERKSTRVLSLISMIVGYVGLGFIVPCCFFTPIPFLNIYTIVFAVWGALCSTAAIILACISKKENPFTSRAKIGLTCGICGASAYAIYAIVAMCIIFFIYFMAMVSALS